MTNVNDFSHTREDEECYMEVDEEDGTFCVDGEPDVDPDDIYAPKRKFFGIDPTKKTICWNSYHKEFLNNLRKEYVMRNIDTQESKKYLMKNDKDEADAVVENIIKTITNIKGITLYTYQLNFVKVIIPTLFKKIYRKVWKQKRNEILEEHGMDDVYDEVCFRSPRRMGKTITLAYTALSIVTNMTKMEHRPFRCAVFATTKDASIRFIDECELGWNNIDTAKNFIYSRRATKIKIIRKNDPSDVREIEAYCGSGCVSYFFKNFWWKEKKKKMTLIQKKTLTSFY